ncbi:hypothetical protein L208DRAFT_1266106 [Tricholoma matsutake]|nr:hypothetical protein L208DRAFT_1266106 [Tricholoma matsutake 945]
MEQLPCPLFSPIYRRDFQRGPSFADGMSFFAGEDIWTPQQFGVIGEVQALCLHDEYAILLLDRPQACGSTMCLVCCQQISALERIELEDDAVDERLSVVSISVLHARDLCF